MNTHSITYGRHTIPFELIFSDRKNLQIEVLPDGHVVVKAPEERDMDEILNRVQKRARWIMKQIRFFRQFEPRQSSKYFKSGETHLYLGKRYRLKVFTSDEEKVALKRGVFEVGLPDTASVYVKKLMEQWYRNKAQNKFQERLELNFKLFPELQEKPQLQLRKLIKRWGSLSAQNRLTLNPDLIKAPVECIDYVILHELCHSIHFNHGSSFYRLLTGKMPDWQKRKHKLEVMLA